MPGRRRRCPVPGEQQAPADPTPSRGRERPQQLQRARDSPDPEPDARSVGAGDNQLRLFVELDTVDAEIHPGGVARCRWSRPRRRAGPHHGDFAAHLRAGLEPAEPVLAASTPAALQHRLCAADGVRDTAQCADDSQDSGPLTDDGYYDSPQRPLGLSQHRHRPAAHSDRY